jgi:hypothetical protein
MFPPDTNLGKQEQRHRAPLPGMGTVVILALTLLALLAVFVVVRRNDPGEPGTGADGTPPGAAIQQTE